MTEERRKNSRIYVSFPIECNILPKQEYFYTVSKDLSESGIRILSNEFLSKSNCLKLNINLIDKVLGVKAKVIWCNKERINERYCAGLEFLEMSPENREYINSVTR